MGAHAPWTNTSDVPMSREVQAVVKKRGPWYLAAEPLTPNKMSLIDIILGKDTMIKINGKTFFGNDLSIVGGKTYIDGVQVDPNGDGSLLSGVVKVEVTGTIASLKTDASVSCQNVDGPVSAGGSINSDKISGDAKADGSINCEDVGGNVAAGGSVRCGKVGGNVTAGGSVRHG